MKRKGQKLLSALIGLLLALTTVSPTLATDSAASDRDAGWRLRVYAASIDFNSANGYGRGSRPDYDLDLGFGFGLNAEYRFSRRLGVDLGILGGAAIDVAWNSVGPGEWVWAGYDTLTITPLTVGLDIHLSPDKNVDLYVCPMVAWIHYGGLVVHSGTDWTSTTVKFDEDIGLGLALGLAVPIGQREKWSFAANLAFLESGLESDAWNDGRMTGDYDATILGLGFGYRF
jgi:hypothetical protein